MNLRTEEIQLIDTLFVAKSNIYPMTHLSQFPFYFLLGFTLDSENAQQCHMDK